MLESLHVPPPDQTRTAGPHIPFRSNVIPRRQRGAIGIMVAVTLPVVIGFIGLSLELSRLYNRKAEMQGIGDAIAISAAKNLNGTQAGIDSAVAAAHEVVETGYDWTKPRFQYKGTMVLSEAALRFATSADGSGGWLDVQSARAAPQGIAYVKVDTNQLDAKFGKVDLLFMRVLTATTSLQVGHTAVAGRSRLKLTPFAICAMSKNPATPIQARMNTGYPELTEYGFRRGVSYNLMQLSPNTATPQTFLVDPISLPPKVGSLSTSIVGQYVCTGTVELPAVMGRTVNVQSGFPIAQLYNHLNSRFDASSGACSATSAPPDSNIKQFTYTANTWMARPTRQVAETAATATSLQTIADLDPPNNQTPTRYGPLWAFARPVPWSAYVSGQSEPAAGYTPFSATQAVWNALYSTGPTLNTYPSGTSGLQSPYFTQVSRPTIHPPGVQYRRVLNVPLLQCPVAGATATVVAIGRFFMTVPADATSIYAEFAGVRLQEEVSGAVEMVQ